MTGKNFLCSSVVELSAVNRWVAGSSPVKEDPVLFLNLFNFYINVLITIEFCKFF